MIGSLAIVLDEQYLDFVIDDAVDHGVWKPGEAIQFLGAASVALRRP